MFDDLQLNVPLLRRRVPNLTTVARAAGLRSATVSNLCTGKTPVGRAEVRTIAALAALAGCSLDELIIRGSGVAMIETGIKALDLFAPVVRGGTVGLVARPGMGQLVLLGELMLRLRKRGFATLLWDPQTDVPGLNLVREHAEIICTNKDEVHKQTIAIRDERDILLAVDRTMVLSGELFSLREQLQEAGTRPVTFALVDTRGEAADEEAPFGPLDTLWRFDTDLISRGFYPAVDPVFSTSTVLEGAQLDAVHLTIQQRARKLLRRYRELRPLAAAQGLEKMTEFDRQLYKRGERLESFLTQPFFVAEPHTKKPGETLSLYDTLDDVRRILDGVIDDLEPEQLFFKGRLVIPQA